MMLHLMDMNDLFDALLLEDPNNIVNTSQGYL